MCHTHCVLEEPSPCLVRDVSAHDVPTHSCPSQVAGYKDFVKERFERCLDLYLCPRAIKKNVDVDPDRYAHT